MIKMFVFDIDGVVTDGKRYTDGKLVFKALQMKDLDAINLFAANGYKIGCISGEHTEFSSQFLKMEALHYVKLGCKDKRAALQEFMDQSHIELREVCYIGDGKYDIPALELAGLAICPGDAIQEVKDVADIVLERKGGDGCLAECYSVLTKHKETDRNATQASADCLMQIQEKMIDHQNLTEKVFHDDQYLSNINKAIEMITDCYKKGGQLFLCGNGGSAADAQHLATEFVGRFYAEREAWNAEALTTNTSIITALANDYDFNLIFARQLEAKGKKGDIIIGITTSGTSGNIRMAFQKAKEIGMATILMTGNVSEYLDILKDTDCLLSVPSKDTPRIQEVHIMTGHIICEYVEQQLITYGEKK